MKSNVMKTCKACGQSYVDKHECPGKTKAACAQFVKWAEGKGLLNRGWNWALDNIGGGINDGVTWLGNRKLMGFPIMRSGYIKDMEPSVNSGGRTVSIDTKQPVAPTGGTPARRAVAITPGGTRAETPQMIAARANKAKVPPAGTANATENATLVAQQEKKSPATM